MNFCNSAARSRFLVTLGFVSLSSTHLARGETAANEATPIPPNAHGAVVSPTTAAVLHPQDDTPIKPVGPLTPISNSLAGHGVTLRGVFINQAAGNPVGGVRQSFTNVGEVNLGTDVNLQKLLAVPGASFHATLYRDYGYSLAKQDTGTLVRNQSIYKNDYTKLRLGTLAYEQKMLDDRSDVVLGRLGTSPFYGHLVPACQFQSGATCGVPTLLGAQAGSVLPAAASFAGNWTLHPRRDMYIEAGAFEVDPTIVTTNGLDWSVQHATGVTFPVEVGWSRPNLSLNRYPFELKTGFYDSTATHNDPSLNAKGLPLAIYGGTPRQDTGRKGVYVMGDRAVWRPDARASENLSVFGGYVQPIDRSEIFDRQVFGGVVLNGLFASRLQDSIGVMTSYLQLSPQEVAFLDSKRARLGGTGRTDPDEEVIELNYGVSIINHVRLSPNVQYVVHPDNVAISKTSIRPHNVLVLGLDLTIGVTQILGFASDPDPG